MAGKQITLASLPIGKKQSKIPYPG